MIASKEKKTQSLFRVTNDEREMIESIGKYFEKTKGMSSSTQAVVIQSIRAYYNTLPDKYKGVKIEH